MMMLSDVLIFAAKHQESPELALFLLAVAIIIGVIAVIGSINKTKYAVWRNGLPYCPRCGIQVSLKASRTHCRSCGHNLTQPPTTLTSAPTSAQQSRIVQVARIRLLEKERQRRARMERLRQLEEDRQKRDAEGIALRAEQEKAYRDKGIEPGAWAWFQVLPALTQAIIVGMAVAIPAGLILVLVFRAISHAVGQ
jgi:hypothetical protein